MALDDRLKALQSLEVGNVERAITGIEKAKLETETTAEEVIEEIKAYRDAVEEKLPRIINNIAIMGIHVVELGDFCNNGLWVTKNKKIVTLRKYMPGCKSDFMMDFNEDISLSRLSLRKPFSLRKPIISKKHWYSIPKYMGHYLINSKTSEDFTAKYLNLIISEFEKGDFFKFSDLLPTLNGVPDEIKREYERRKDEKKAYLKRIQSHNGKLEGLDTSDFR